MGDDLAEILFDALQEAGAEIPPFRKLRFDELDFESRGHWERVALAARREMGRRFTSSMRDAVAFHGAEQAIANLLEAEDDRR